MVADVDIGPVWDAIRDAGFIVESIAATGEGQVTIVLRIDRGDDAAI